MEVIEKYRAAGRILVEVMEAAVSRVDVGVPLLEVAELVEARIKSLGGEPAFPCNISLNRIAAHYTPSPGDESRFGEDMVKLDIGVHVDGYIADSAVTVDLSGHDGLVEASRAALEAAMELIGPGVNTSQLGLAIEEAIVGYGFRPVSNLTGHGLQRYQAHAQPAVPNVAMERGVELRPGDVIAIEPFATDGSGRISEASVVEIFGFTTHRPIRLPLARKLMLQIQNNYESLPFARRWIEGERVDYALNQLLKNGVIHSYPVLWEVEGSMVSQAEHTVLIKQDGCEVITARS